MPKKLFPAPQAPPRKDLRPKFKALALTALVEAVFFLTVATVTWAVAKHDFEALDRSFYAYVRSERFAQIVGGVLALIVAFNLFGIFMIARRGEKIIALLGLTFTAGLVALFVLPMRASVYGLGGTIGALIALKLLKLLWLIVSWPVRRMRRKPADVPKPAAPPPPAAPPTP